MKNNDTIAQYLTQATIMVVSVTASTTQGKNLTKEELDIGTSSCAEKKLAREYLKEETKSSRPSTRLPRRMKMHKRLRRSRRRQSTALVLAAWVGSTIATCGD